jgi:hypothetical protein
VQLRGMKLKTENYLDSGQANLPELQLQVAIDVATRPPRSG